MNIQRKFEQQLSNNQIQQNIIGFNTDNLYDKIDKKENNT